MKDEKGHTYVYYSMRSGERQERKRTGCRPSGLRSAAGLRERGRCGMMPAKGCDRMTNYKELTRQLAGLIGGVPHRTANLANASALVFSALPGLNWAGFYLLEGETLVLGPFQGKPACIEIPLGRGVCGTAAAKDETQVVADVHVFPGHIACDSASNSEIVVPIHGPEGAVVGVLDIDSVLFDRFDAHDRAGLEELVSVLERELFPPA